MNPRIMRCGRFPLAGLLFSIALQIQAATFYVGWDSDFGFSPSSVTINVGDTVVWTDNDPDWPTQITSDNSFGDPNWFTVYLADIGETGQWTFDTVGTIGYHDDWGNSGSVTINNSTPVTISLAPPRLSDGAFVFDADGLTAGKTNVLEVSTNLTDWTAVVTNVAANSSQTFTNSVDAGSHLYRVVQLP